MLKKIVFLILSIISCTLVLAACSTAGDDLPSEVTHQPSKKTTVVTTKIPTKKKTTKKKTKAPTKQVVSF